MPALRLFLCLALVSLAACTDPRKTALSRLRRANLEEIRKDLAQLHTQHFSAPGPEFVPIRPESWPSSVLKLNPLRMTLYRDGLAVAIQDRPGVEFGLHFVPSGDIAPPRTTQITLYDPLQERIYFYTQKR